MIHVVWYDARGKNVREADFLTPGEAFRTLTEEKKPAHAWPLGTHRGLYFWHIGRPKHTLREFEARMAEIEAAGGAKKEKEAINVSTVRKYRDENGSL